MKWVPFPYYWPFMSGNHRLPFGFPAQGASHHVELSWILSFFIKHLNDQWNDTLKCSCDLNLMCYRTLTPTFDGFEKLPKAQRSSYQYVPICGPQKTRYWYMRSQWWCTETIFSFMFNNTNVPDIDSSKFTWENLWFINSLHLMMPYNDRAFGQNCFRYWLVAW